ncbi:MAG: hypothetical protein K2Q33_02845 [Gammaproteobacteria bacterium]|nr:hypothetical protein [Gammaproteobacteria bacterium]
MKTLTKHTHISKVREINKGTSEQICELLNWDWDRFCRHQYNCYETFIAKACELLPQAKEVLRYSPVFRGWFCNEWIKRNELDFLPFAIAETTERFGFIGDKFEEFELMEKGDIYLIDEYLMINCPNRLYYDDDFSLKYSVIVDEILRTKAWKN